MRAIILAGGIGALLRPFTTLMPKLIVPIGNKYLILEILIRHLVKDNFSRSAIAFNHLSHLIQTYFRGRKI